jgi:hypothetical protein
VSAFTVFTDLSSLTAPSMVMRQPPESLSPWTAMSANSAGSVVVTPYDHGGTVSSTRCR